jgi:hypothetical protein
MHLGAVFFAVLTSSIYSFNIGWWLFKLFELRHGDLVAKMPLQELVCNEALGSVSLCIHKRHVMVHLTYPLQLVGMAMMVRAPIDTDQEDGDMDPREAEDVKFELVHISGFSIEQQQESQHGSLWTSLPSIDRMVSCRFGVLLEMQLLDFLPARHHSCSPTKPDVPPH